MIKTVFYFTETEQQYLSLWRNGEVSPNTIVLCKDTHSLWKGGERYGVGSTPGGDDYVPYDDTEIVERINDIVEQLEDLAEQIGQGEKGMTDEEKEQMENLAEQLVVVSNGLDTANEVAASEKQRLNGLLDGIQASIDSMTAQAEADKASIQQLAADIQSQAASIQEHSEWIQNREEEDTTSWKSGWNANIEAYLQEVGIWARDNGITETQFTQLSLSVDTISSSVNSLQEDMQTKATKTEFSTITQRADSIETRVASVETGLEGKATSTQFSQLSQTVDGINTRVSSVEEDVEGKVGASEFSTLSQRVNSIDLAVQALTPSEDGSISDQMQATIEQAVRDGVAELNLSATYAKKSTETDLEATQDELEDAEKVLEWMYSGLKISTDPEKTFNELVSAGKEGLANAVADLRTYVQKLKNGDYVASTAITSAVNNAIAALYSEASDNNAKSLIFSKIASNTNSIDGLETDMGTAQDAIEQLQDDLSDGLNNINQNTQDIAAIVTSATGDNTSATIATKFANWKAGLATTSYVDGATAGLVSSDVLDQRVASFISQSDLDAATATMASKTEVEGLGTRLSSVETKANANEASITNLTKTGGRIAQVEQKASDTEAAISGLVDASTDTVTASKIWESLANDNSVISSMRSQFATTVDGDGIASLVKEDIAQSVNNSTWDQWVAYMKGDVATAVNNYQTATANKAQWDAVVAYVDGKKTDIESIDDLSDSISGLNTSLAGLSSSVGTIEDEVTGIKSNYAKTSMFAQIKDNQGNVTAASIAAAVNGTTGSSKVTIDADHIDVSGVLTVANNAASAASAAQNTADSALAATTTIDGGNITTGTINSDRLNVSTIVGKINSSTGQNKLTINADHIDVSGVLTVANNAANAASAAQSAANAAQNTADNAQSTANSALTATTTIDGGNITTGTINADRLDVSAIVGKINNSTGSSKLTIDADHIDVSGVLTVANNAATAASNAQTTADNAASAASAAQSTADSALTATTTIDGGNITTGTINSDRLNVSTIVGKINATTGSSKLVIDADHIDVSGVLTVANNAASAASAAQSSVDALSNTVSGKMDSSSFTQGNIIKAINGNTNTTTIDGGKITTGTITATQIAANAITSAKINAGAITAEKIATGAITADKIAAGSITADKIAAGAITTNTLTASKVINASQGVNSNTKVDGNGVRIYFTREGVSGESGSIELNADGSGYLAASNISWGSNGGFNLTSGSSGKYIRYNPTDGYLDAVISSLEVDNGVIIGGDTAINGELSASDATIGSIETAGNVSIGGNLEVSGTISGSFGALSTTSVTASGDIAGGSLAIKSGNTTNASITSAGAITAKGLTVYGTSTFQSAASGSTSIGTISSMGVFTSSSEEMTLDGAITSTGSLSSSGLTVKQGNTTTISTTSGGAITAAGKIKGGSLEATGSVYSRSLYVRDANANNIFSVESSGTVEAKALQIKSSGSVIAGINSTGLITGKKLSLAGSADNMIRVSYGTQYADITSAEYKITDSSSTSAAHLTSSYLSVSKSGNTAKLGIDSSGNIEFSGTSNENSNIWPTVTRDTTANTITKGRVYAITLGDLKTMIQDSSGTYSTKYGNWSVMLTRTV